MKIILIKAIITINVIFALMDLIAFVYGVFNYGTPSADFLIN